MPSEDAQEVAEILDAVSGRVPALLRSVLDQVYSPEAGRRMGQAIGAFYRELTESGLPPERALELAENYASPLGILRSVMGEGGGSGGQGMPWSWSSSSGRPKRTRPGAAPAQTAEPRALEDLFNNVGTSDDGAPASADLDGVGWSLSAQALAAAGVVPGGAVSVDGLSFRWPQAAPGRPNNVQVEGQRVLLPPRGNARRLGVLGLATHGPSVGLATLRSADGRTQSVALSFPDWALNGGQGDVPLGTQIAVRLPRRNGRENEDAGSGVMVFATSLPLPPGVPLESLTLPAQVDQGTLHIFALAFGD